LRALARTASDRGSTWALVAATSVCVCVCVCVVRTR
jgi:hypothetical protein